MENLQGGIYMCMFAWWYTGDDGVSVYHLHDTPRTGFDALANWAMTQLDGLPADLDYGYINC
jgi:hypothetical protein